MIATSTRRSSAATASAGIDEAEEPDGDAGDDAGDPLPAHRARHHLSEEDMADEIDDRACDDRNELRRVQRLRRMGDHDLVADGRDDDAGDENDVEEGVAVAGHRRPVIESSSLRWAIAAT